MSEAVPRFIRVSPNSCETDDRRREPRFPATAVVEVEIQKPDFQRVQATVFEVSRSGLGMVLPLAVEEGTRVKINLKHVVIFGEVRHCRAANTGFSAGVSVKEISSLEKFDQLNDCELDLYSILVQFAQLE